MRNKLKIILIVLIDMILTGAALVIFAWFHHGKPQRFEPVALATTPPVVTASPSPSPSPTPVPTELPQGVTPGPTPEPTFTPEPTPEPTGLLGAKYWEKFTDGEIISDENCYRSRNVCVEVSHRSMVSSEGLPVVYHVADVYIRDITSLGSYVPDPEAGNEYVDQMAVKTGSIVGITGDYFLYHKIGLIIRSGMLYREKYYTSQDWCVIYRDGVMETHPNGMIDLKALYARGPWHTFSFGPRLLDNGQPMTEFNTSVEERNPRTAIGYYEPGHYCFVVVDGRQNNYSYGLEMWELSKLMYDLGCAEAFNLDGGSTSIMTYGPGLYSRPPYGGHGRHNTDYIYILEPSGDGYYYGG